MAKSAVFLQLAPEFGGTKFGPFQGVEVRLGSDPGKNDIVLPEALGVVGEHVKVIKQSEESFIVAPVTRTATVFLFRGGSPKQVTTPTAASAGDSFSVVTAEGPRFQILVEQAGTDAGKGAVGPSNKKKKASVSEGILDEMRRIGMAKFFTTKVGNFFQTAWRMIKTGQIFSPRYIVLGMMMIIPLVLAGGFACSTAGLWSAIAGKDKEIEELKGDVAACGGGDEDPTVPSLVKDILNDNEWEQTLLDDKELLPLFTAELKKVFENQDKYAWVWKRKASDFVTAKTQLDRQLGPQIGSILAYVTANPGYVTDRTWTLLKENTDGARSCQRGPMLMTYRQSVNLGLTVRPDALADVALAESDDVELKGTAIKSTIGTDEVDFQLEEIELAPVELQGGFVCMYLTGDDDRDDIKDVATGLKKSLGTTGKGLPGEGEDYWLAARVAKFWAADMTIGFEDLDFKQRPSAAMDAARSSEKQFALQHTAETMARAVAIPCLAVMESLTTNTPMPEHMGEPPTLMQCGVLRLFVDYTL